MSPDYTSDEMAFVAVTPDHIDVFSLHAGLCVCFWSYESRDFFYLFIYLFILLLLFFLLYLIIF